jgi:hypothetical protein
MGFQKAKKLPEEVEQIDESDYKSHFKVRGQYKDKDDNYVGVTHKIKYVKDAGHAKRVASEKVGKQYKDYKVIRATPFSVSEEVANDYLMSELEEGFEDEKLVAQKVTKTRGAADYFSNLAASGEKGIARTHRRLLDKDVHTTAAKTSKAADKAHSDVKKTAVANFVASRKGDGKVRTEEAEKAPFEGGREVKSNKSAAERVKKIAKGMEKLNTPKKDNK